MTEFTPFPEFEEKLRLALTTPEPDPVFAQALRSRLSAHMGTPATHRSFHLRPAWGILLGLVLLVILAVLAVGPQRVAAEVQKLLGYIPGFGIVDQNASLRVLEGPVTETRDGITVTVKQAFLTSDKTVLTYTVEGVPWSALSHNENITGCSGASNLRLPDGTLLMLTGGGGTPQESTINYPPIPANVNHATFVLPCIMETLPGLAPENWELPLRFTATSPDLTVMPVIDVSPSPEAQINTPAASTNPLALYGISLAIDKYIPLDDGYYLIGHTEWTDGRITSAWPAGWALKAYDARGQEVALEPADWQDAGLTPGANQWLYRLYGKSFNAPLTLRATQMNVAFKQPVKLTLDMRSYGFDGSDAQLGMVWKFGGIPLDVPGLSASVFKVTYIKLGDMKGFEIVINADPALQGLPFTIESGLDTAGMAMVRGGGGGGWDETSGLVLSTVLTDAKITFPLVLSASGATVNGPWEATWNPPAGDPNATPATVAQACVTLEAWKQAAGTTIPLPTGLPDRVLVLRGALAPDPSLFISSLDGSTNQGLVFGQGSLSPDGTQLAYSGADDHLYVMDVSTKQSTLLTDNTFDLHPLWSPEGTRIAFTRLTDKGYNVFVMDADGRNVRALTDTTENTLAAGWTPDGQKVIGVGTKDGGELVQLLDVVNSTAQELNFIRQSGNVDVSISPDGEWVAFTDKVLGRMAPGIFISRLDGSDRRLLVQLDTWTVRRPRWSPDGNWLAFTLMDADQYSTPPTPALVNVATCQVVPLNGLNGEIEGWLK